eukprot:TRINITY_DN15085_c0_g1_i2.p1 TRINITY_DN15085_c0_g1~~TRINITY_DN15085_c0_g1_i2.p1  ORF type:complete len:293 (+),score=37.75 TRINITY_DN15085_c0_g1_i2:223-1101(+)
MAPKKTRSTSRSRKLRSASQTGEALTLARPEIAIEEHPPSRHRRPGSKEPGRKANAKKVIEPAPPPYTGPRPDTELVHAVSEVVSPSSGGLAGQNVEYIYSMIRSGEDVNQYSVGGFTPLAVAAIAGDDPLVSLLLEKGADASFASMDRHELPLHHAARLGHRIVCQLLVPPTREAGVLDAANNLGWSPLHLATEAGHTEVAHLLLRGRADVHCENAIYSRVTAAHVAARNHDCDTLEELLDGGANPIAIDSTGRAHASRPSTLPRHPATTVAWRCFFATARTPHCGAVTTT